MTQHATELMAELDEVPWYHGVSPPEVIGAFVNGSESEALEPEVAEGPSPLMKEVPPGEPYPLAALGPLEAAARAVQDKTQAPAAIAAQSALGVTALVVQGHADVETLHGRAPASLFLLTVAKSGERKSSCDKLVMQAVREYEAELAEIYRADHLTHRNAHEVWTERRKAILKNVKSDPEDVQTELDALGSEPAPPLYPAVVAGEPTLEGIVKHMGRLRPALGLFTDEGGGFVGGVGMNSENRLKTVAGLSRLWDGAPVDRWRAGDGVSVYPGRRMSMHILLQPIAAEGLLADPLANGQGFLARCLLTDPASTIGTRTRVGHDPASDTALAAFSARIGDLLRRPLPHKDGTKNELEPRLLTLSKDARAVLQAFALHVEVEQAEDKELAGVTAFASKAAEHAARLAGVLTLYEQLDATEVTGTAMSNAVLLATYYLNEAARLTGAAIITRDTTDAEILRRWLTERWGEDFISITDATQRGPFRETKRNRELFSTLERHGWLRGERDGAVVLGKRRREAFRIVGRKAR